MPPQLAMPAMVVQDEKPLHILFFPFLAAGHLIPVTDMAVLFAGRGVRCTILTTPVNVGTIRSAVDRANDAFAGTSSPAIHISVVPFPDVGLPPGAENLAAVTSEEDTGKFIQALYLIREPFDRFLVDSRPDAVVSDSFFPWSVDACAEHGVPRIGFLGNSMFARACNYSMVRNNPVAAAPNDPDALVSLPGLPHRVELRRSQMMDPANEAPLWGFFQSVIDADQRSFGEVFNSFHELEPDYVEYYHTTLGRRAWLVGPVALAKQGHGWAGRGQLPPVADSCLRWLDADSCLRWLDAKPDVSFGTLTSFSPAERHQLARGLDLSGMNFVWVIGAADSSPEWMPEGFAELIAPGGRGFIVRGWAPQVLILNHPAVGGFVTHCGWNSALEAVSAGVPMVTWPRYTDQFSNETLIVELLKVGVSSGAKEYASRMETHEVIAGEVIAEAIGRLMESDAVRKKAKDLAMKAKSAVEGGGSSYDAVGRLIDELMARRSSVYVGQDIQTAS